ncbi:MAG: CoA pyrophosphatase [Gammaproteobacteria bacterium]|nr:CoA pyrophosphatase [Gammaproteobacteria bacterium]
MLCDGTLHNKIKTNLDAFEVRTASATNLKSAAVAITVTDVGMGADVRGIEDENEWSYIAALMLTRRSAKLRHHPGQWAFPGGRVEPGETLVQTALREMSEEVNVALDESRVLGVLDDFVTRSGFAMTPVVVWGGTDLQAKADPDEVQSIHRIPLQEFMRDDSPLLIESQTSEHPILRMPIGEDYIAAPTAAIIYQFREVCLLGNDVRVAHYEQPEFAWR